MTKVLASSLFVLFFVGCNQGVQRGKFTVSSTGGVSLIGQTGNLVLFHGHRQHEYEKKILVLGIVFVDPHQLTANRGGTSSHVRMTSKFDLADFRGSDRKVTCKWHRGTGEVSFGKDVYNRSEGEIFVVVVTGENELEVSQIKADSDTPTPDQILDLARKEVPDYLGGADIRSGIGK